jgi:hypothetical protein
MKIALFHAAPIAALLLGLIYGWFAIANRYHIFLYNHLGATPFDEVTRSRYWMAGLVAAGLVLVLYTPVNWVIGRLAGTRGRVYIPPAWWRVWLICLTPLTIGILLITMTCNAPTLPLTDALAVLAAARIGAVSPAAAGGRIARPGIVGAGLAGLHYRHCRHAGRRSVAGRVKLAARQVGPIRVNYRSAFVGRLRLELFAVTPGPSYFGDPARISLHQHSLQLFRL